jgi:hypothetical protein
MRRSLKLMGLAIFLSLMLTGGIVFATGDTSTTVPTPGTPVVNPQPQGKCCIAGKYQGTQTRIASKGCTAETGKFMMEINQDKGCGSKIWGKIISGDGTTNDFKGTVTAGLKGCCNISGSFGRPATATEPAERTDFKGVLCKKGGKWAGKGTYRTTRGTIICNGTWEISQM